MKTYFLYRKNICTSINENRVSSLLKRENLKIRNIPEDGFCLLKSVQVVLKDSHNFDLSVNDIKDKLAKEMRLNKSYYLQFYEKDEKHFFVN